MDVYIFSHLHKEEKRKLVIFDVQEKGFIVGNMKNAVFFIISHIRRKRFHVLPLPTGRLVIIYYCIMDCLICQKRGVRCIY